MGEYQESRLDLFTSLVQLRLDRKIQERLSPVTNFEQAAQIRSQADRIQAVSGQLHQSTEQETASGIAGELRGMAGMLVQSLSSLKETSTLLVGLVNKEFAADQRLEMPGERTYVEACFWRNRVIGDLFAASSYYRLTAELLSLAVKTLGKVSPSAKPGDNSLLLNHAATLLSDAAKQMGTAGTELGEYEARSQNLERALASLETKK